MELLRLLLWFPLFASHQDEHYQNSLVLSLDIQRYHVAMRASTILGAEYLDQGSAKDAQSTRYAINQEAALMGYWRPVVRRWILPIFACSPS
jgi:hypothetical protein